MKMLVLTAGVLPDTFSGIETNVFYLSRQLRRMARGLKRHTGFDKLVLNASLLNKESVKFWIA